MICILHVFCKFLEYLYYIIRWPTLHLGFFFDFFGLENDVIIAFNVWWELGQVIINLSIINSFMLCPQLVAMLNTHRHNKGFVVVVHKFSLSLLTESETSHLCRSAPPKHSFMILSTWFISFYKKILIISKKCLTFTSWTFSFVFALVW